MVSPHLCTDIRYGSSLRAAPASVTLDRAARLADRLGITRVTDITRLDRLGIPVYASIRPSAPRGSLCVNAGKGMTMEEAQAGAYMEAIEFAVAQYGASNLEVVEVPAREILGGNWPDNALDLAPRLSVSIGPDARMACVEAEEMVSGERWLVPAELVFLPFPAHVIPERYYGSSSNGLSSGNTTLEATVHGVAELIERDITSHFLMRDGSALVEPDGIPDHAQALVRQIRAAGMELTIRHQPNSFGISWFSATLIDLEDFSPLYINGGYGCHPCRSIALLRAITEAVQSRLSFIHGGRDDLTVRHDRVMGWTAAERMDYTRRLADSASSSERTIHYEDTPDHSDLVDDLQSAFDCLARCLASAGMSHICRVRYTDSSDDLHVVRVIVPGLEYFSETSPRVGRRLRDYVSAKT